MRTNQRIQALPIAFGLGLFLITGCGETADDHAGHDHSNHSHGEEEVDNDGMAVTSRQNTLTKIFMRHLRRWKRLHSLKEAVHISMVTH